MRRKGMRLNLFKRRGENPNDERNPKAEIRYPKKIRRPKSEFVSSADLQSAVSPICNRQSAHLFWSDRIFEESAECNSAIQQISNLRYRIFSDFGFRISAFL